MILVTTGYKKKEYNSEIDMLKTVIRNVLLSKKKLVPTPTKF